MSDLDEQRVDQMLKLAKTKAELQDLVRSLDAANVRLRRARDDLATAPVQSRLNGGQS
ncbi:hypothetical protein [Kocuria sp. CPCC 205263]|uniref:hypothetical protein n=1 Tax=Kocuria sp. CPCC 205263 TaxID=3073555 RepID=UPI0034D3E6E3